MIAITGNNFIYFDVDDTLVDWNKRDTEDALPFGSEATGGTWFLTPKWNVIRKLKAHKEQGDTVVVWPIS